MTNVILASTSSLFGEAYLSYLKTEISLLFQHVQEIIFIPYARPGGLTHDEYTARAAGFFRTLNIEIKGLHTFKDPQLAITEGQAFFTGGGNTFLLVKQLHELQLMTYLKTAILAGKPYLGTSAGSNIAGPTMQTTNDMPIVYPPDFSTMGILNFNINAHYLDPDSNLKHNGETRETRIKEFHVFNSVPVAGLREGSWIRLKDGKVTTEGSRSTRIFLPGQEAMEYRPGASLDLLG